MRRASHPVLGLETSSRLLGVALVRGEEVLGSRERLGPAPNADALRTVVEEVLDAAHLTVEALGGIAVSIGPGSFTGLRIGVSFVKGLVVASDVPVIAVPTLEAIAHNCWSARGTVCVVVDAKQDKLYAACYRATRGRFTPLGHERLGTIPELSSLLRCGTLLVGDGLARYGGLLQRQLKRSVPCAPQELWWPRATTVARLGARALAHGRRDDPQTLTPRYLYSRYCSIQHTGQRAEGRGQR